MAKKQLTPEQEETRVQSERNKNAHPGFFLRAATWLLARFPLTKNKYQNWTSGRRILIGWLLWIICLPIIPIVAAAVWYLHDPEGFKKSPWAKALVALIIVWAGMFGIVATEPAQLDQNGKYSPVQTQADGEKGDPSIKPQATASEASKAKVAKQSKSNPSDGKKFENCTEAFDKGVFNIKRSDPSYQPYLDRDSDGIACEK